MNLYVLEYRGCDEGDDTWYVHGTYSSLNKAKAAGKSMVSMSPPRYQSFVNTPEVGKWHRRPAGGAMTWVVPVEGSNTINCLFITRTELDK